MIRRHVFSTNPLSLSLPDSAFDSWLREKGYLDILDERTNAGRANDLASPSTPSFPPIDGAQGGGSGELTFTFARACSSFLSALTTAASILTASPFAKLTADDFSGETPSWTTAFLGCSSSYSWPSCPSQARMRVHENVKRYARCYSMLALVFFACSLYQMPLALFGLFSTVCLWEGFICCSNRWELERRTHIRQTLLRLIQFATACVLYVCNMQVALFCSLSVGYAVMILHASLRKLTPWKQQDQAHKRFPKLKYWS